MARRSINFNSKAERVWQWVFPSLLVALAPVLAQYFISFFNLGVVDYSWLDLRAHISPHGELLIITVALVAESASEIWRRQITGWQKDFIGSLCMVFVIIATLTFAGLTSNPTNAITISSRSFEFFLIGISLCVLCKVAGRS